MRMIDADALKREMTARLAGFAREIEDDGMSTDEAEMAIKEFDHLFAESLKAVIKAGKKRGRWRKYLGDQGLIFRCSVCGGFSDRPVSRCKCGARMTATDRGD